MNAPKRFLLMKSENTVNILWLDGVGTCDHETLLGDQYRTRWHVKRDAEGRTYTLLCPNGLDEKEWARVFVDQPPGSWQRHFADYQQGPPRKTRAVFDEAV